MLTNVATFAISFLLSLVVLGGLTFAYLAVRLSVSIMSSNRGKLAAGLLVLLACAWVIGAIVVGYAEAFGCLAAVAALLFIFRNR